MTSPGGSQFRCAICRVIYVKGAPAPPAPEELAPPLEVLDSFPGFTPAECHLVCETCFELVRDELGIPP